MSELVVSCRGLSRTYQDDSVPVRALRGVDFDVARGEFVSLAGPSGSGKSTLLNIIGGLDRPDEGSVKVDGVELNDLSESALSDLRLTKMGFVFQAYNLIPVLSARENVEFIMQLQGVAAQERHSRAVAMLEELGLEGMADRRPGELSGGQQQRVAVARAIVTHPVLLLADEPSANLDSSTTEELLNLLRRLNENHGVTIVTATHDPLVMSFAPPPGAPAGRADCRGQRQAGCLMGRLARRAPVRSLLLASLLLVMGGGARALEFDARAKLFGAGAALPEHNIQRQLEGTPAYDYTADLRLMFVEDRGRVRLSLDHQTILNGGDSFAFSHEPRGYPRSIPER